MASLQVIKRTAIPSTIVAGTGELRDFRWSDALGEFMPPASRLSMRWLQLPAEGILEARLHPAQTLLMVCAGSGTVLGDLDGTVGEGDTVVVPAGSECGLEAGAEGLTVVSFQFGQGLSATIPPPDSATDRHDGTPSLDGLLSYAGRRLQAFEDSPLFTLLDGDVNEAPKALREALELWSTSAQGLLFGSGPVGSRQLRRSSSMPPATESWRPPRRDSIIEAITNWFAYQTHVLDSVERSAIIRLVVEPARMLCERRVSAALGRAAPTTGQHARTPVDDNLLDYQSPRIYGRLEAVVREAWDMLDAMADRVVDLAQVK